MSEKYVNKFKIRVDGRLFISLSTGEEFIINPEFPLKPGLATTPDDISFAAIMNIVLQQQRQIDELKEIIKQKK